MMTPSTTDPQARAQQRIFLILPLFSIIYGSFLPAGLFLYWIVFTAYSIVQQYLIVGWGSLFPLFGWTPGFAQDHTAAIPGTSRPVAQQTKCDRAATAAKKNPAAAQLTERRARSSRRRQRGRTSRRGRRR